MVFQHNAHFEWVTGSENVIRQLALEVFDTLGVVTDGTALDVAVKGLDGFQENLKTKMDGLVKQVFYRRRSFNLEPVNNGTTTLSLAAVDCNLSQLLLILIFSRVA